MTLLTPAPFAGIIIAAGVLGSAALCRQEWRRPNQRRRRTRLAATVLAVGALALLGLRPAWPAKPPAAGQSEAALWTDGAAAAPAGVPAERRFALPGVAPAGKQEVPDAAYIQRRFPEIGTLHLIGHGLEASDLETLRGLRLVLHGGAPPARPGVRFLFCPRRVTAGSAFVVQGSIEGLQSGQRTALALEDPAGTVTKAVPFAVEGGRAQFEVSTAAPSAPGRFVWRLRWQEAGAGGKILEEEPIGVSVSPPAPPRVLALESAPRFDTASLRRWLGQAGGRMTSRTQVGRGVHRFASTAGGPGEFGAVDAALLAGFDVLLADRAALTALAPGERAALRVAVAETGLGVLLLFDDEPKSGAAEPADAAFFFPWTLHPLNQPDAQTAPAEDAERPARVQWHGLPRPPEAPATVAAFEFLPNEGQGTEIRDAQSRALAVSVQRGRGRLALTLVRNTWRWTQANEPGAFAAYWSFLLGQVARPAGDGAGRWTLAGGDGGPIFVDEPLALDWLGPGDAPGPARVTDEDGAGASLALAQDRQEPRRWRGTFWPRRGGWHRVLMPPDGAALDFCVADATGWPTLRAARRTAATQRFIALHAPDQTASKPRGETVPALTGWLFALLLAGAVYLWAERRLATGEDAAG